MPEMKTGNPAQQEKKLTPREAARQLMQETNQVLSSTSRVRSRADSLLQALQNVRRSQEQRASKAEKMRQLSSQSKAYTSESGMVSAEEAAAARVPAAADEAESVKAPVEAPAAPEKAAPAAAVAEERKPEEARPAEEKAPEAKASEAKPAEEAPKPARTEPRPERKGERPPKDKASAPKKPAVGQIIARAGESDIRRPANPAPNIIRMGRPTTPQQRQQQQGFGQRPPQGAGMQRPQGPRPGGPMNARPQGQGGFAPRTQGGAPQGGRPGFGARPQGAGAARPQGGGSFGRPPMRSRGPEMAPTEEKARVSNYDPNKKQYQRQHDPEYVARNRKQLARDNGFGSSGMDDEVIRGGKRSRVRKPSVQQTMAPIKIETAYMSGDTITVRDLTERIGKTAGEIIKKLLLLGNMATINSEIDYDTASLVASEFGVTLEKKADKTAEDTLSEMDVADDEDQLVPRPPVVTIMGHVDHGKTSLLDYIRKSRVTAGEAGGITQHIGAYTVKVNGRQITFLDTPGHEAFTAMRMRGAQATDIAVLVVAADDSVMPQTIEAINHAKAAEVPIIVAINKIDKFGADPERVKQDLTAHGVVCEEWGGDAICVPVSAKTGEGVDELLEMILLQADTMELRANPERMGRGVIIEAKLDKARGPLATVLLQNGTLHVGDNIVAGMASGRVRALINDRGEKVKSAGPSMPVEIMGFDNVPAAGDEMIAVGDDKLSRQVADERREKLRASREATAAKVSMENLFSSLEEGKTTTLNLIIKADVQGSVEAVRQAMEKLSSDEVRVRVLHAAAGAITKDDVNLAAAFNAIIIGFNIRPDASAREAAEKEKVDVRLYTVIYKAIEDMELAMKGLLAPEYREVLLGHAEVRNVFKITGAGIIAGCYVTDGKVQRNAQVRLLRDNVVVFEGKLSSLRHLKDDVREMAAGYECGMSLEGHNDIKEGDVVECYIMEEIPR